MKENSNKVDRVSEILQTTISSIEKSKEEIFEIVEHSRNECIKLEQELEEIREKVDKVIMEVDRLDIEERKSRIFLSNVSKNFNIYDEDDIKDAYDHANKIRTNFLLKKEEEKNLREQRNEKELRLRYAIEAYKKTENVGKSVSVATGYLKGNLDEIIFTIDDLDKRQSFGIKIIEAQEEERQKLSRDIHDGPAQSMANILIKSELCEKLIDIDEEKAREELKNLRNIAKGTLKDIRKIIYDLRPMSLDDLGLIPTLERYILNFVEDTGIKIDLRVIGTVESLEPAIEVAIFRIVQESLSNIMKHSKSSHGQITIEYSIKRVNIIIKDNGIGFKMEEGGKKSINRNYGFGLTSIRERIELLGGSFNINAMLGKGTKLNMYIPLMEGEQSHGK